MDSANPAKALKKHIDLNEVHVLSEEAGSKIEVKSDREKCDFSKFTRMYLYL